MDRGAWRGTVHGIEKSQTWLSDFHTTLNNFRSFCSAKMSRALELKHFYKASHVILMYSHQVCRNHWPGALARGKGTTKDNAFNIENITYSIRACRMVDLLIDSGASLRQNNEGAIFSLKQYPIFFIPSGLQGSVVPFSCPYQNLLSGQKKKNLMPPLYANE